MKKRWWIGICLAVICFSVCFVGCGKQTPNVPADTAKNDPDSVGTTADAFAATTDQPPDPIQPKEPTFYRLGENAPGIRILGIRNESGPAKIGADWSCSGIELNVEIAEGDISFVASATGNCYFRAYVDGQAWMRSGNDPYYKVGSSDTEILLKNVPAGTHTIRLIKVTGHTLARAQITEIGLFGKILEPAPAAKELYIEFVGDSISCGYGMIGPKDGTYAAQDGSLAFPYLTAQALNADYSITALSGQGLLMGNPGIPAGYLQTSPLRDGNAYDFARKADIVVLNIGTNDRSTGNMEKYGITEEKFGQAYLAFLQTVKEKNGDGCRIVCTYNCMNDTFESALIKAVNDMGGANAGIHVLKFGRTANSTGNWHPDIAEQAAYAETLTQFLRELPEIPETVNEEEVTEEDARGMFVSWGSLKPYWKKD